MSKNTSTKGVSGEGWNFQLYKNVGKTESLKDPLGYRVPIGDIVVKNSAGKKNMT
jgi:hypothetical protein